MRLVDMVGNTPFLYLSFLLERKGIELFAKAEFLNPSGSVKDRAALAMIEDGIESGLLSKGKTILDATSGNTGIAYAMIGAALGYKVRLYAPENLSPERMRILRCYGAELIATSPMEGSDGAYLKAREAALASPDLFFYPDQYNNPANPRAHYLGTGNEIWDQSGGKVTHFIASMGSAGTFVGCARRLKEKNPRIKCVAVQPKSPFHGIEGTKHMASSIKPGNLDESLIDQQVDVTTEEAYEMARRLARTAGIFVGISSGANVAAALRLAEGLPEGSFVATVLCDTGARYSSDVFWEAKK
ncbi:MAG: cysteine synthase family protein [Clostridiales bacterium]|jgi:cysteine synthase B|nr:cysteine synthase family protein [Clostridiales bacterium]